MKGSEFQAMIRSGHKPVVTFLKGVEDQEGYLESGMRGRIISVHEEDDDLLSFTIDLTEFEGFNAVFESSNYFDKAGNACLTAREAGQYQSTESLWGSQENDIPMDLVNSQRTELFQRFLAANAGTSYVHWLEEMVLVKV